MSMNQLVPNPSQAWLWQPTAMSAHQPYYQQGIYGRERMFEKPLTPSDVGKLNRLVIPKQHAEKYFPLDSESGEKGLLLSFEDESGKEWNFRYSYWTSSQSYVLTKGWSRYVKEKRLDAGDIVLFERADDRLFIGCRRRGCSAETATAATSPAAFYYMSPVNSGERQAGSSGESAAAATTTGNSRRLRLFGVNLECGPDPQNLVSASTSQL